MTERLVVADTSSRPASPAIPQRHEAELPQTDTEPARKAAPRWRRLPRLLAVALFFAVVFCGAWLSDDAYVSFRTADNFVHGYGLTWNVQERVQAYTNPLWMLLFSGVYWVTGEAFYTAIFLSIVVSVTAVACFAWTIAKTQAAAILGVLVLTFSVAFVDYSTSGLENPLTHLILVLFLWLYLTREAIAEVALPFAAEDGPATPDGAANRDGIVGTERSRRRRWLQFDAMPGVLSMLAALAAVNRMDSILLFLPALLYVLWKRRTWRCLGWMAAGALPLLLWLGFSLVYYGFPFPNTAYAKLNNGIAATALAKQGCYYLWNSVKFDPLTLSTIVFALGVACWRRRWRELAVALGIALYLLYIVKIGGDFMSGRYLTTPLLAAVCLLGTLRWSSKVAWVPAATAVVALAIVSTRPLLIRSQADFTWDVCWRRIAEEHGICDEGAYYAATEMGVLPHITKELHVQFTDCEWVMMSNALYHIGRYGYYAGPEVHIVDGCALSDPLLARLPPLPDPFWRVGHFRRGIPDGYLATLRSGKNVLRDPGMAEYYDHLTRITQGNLWDRQRWAAIWNMNLGRYEGLLNEAKHEIRMMLPYNEIALPDKPERLGKISRSIVLHPNDPAGYRYRGALYIAQKKPDQAIQDFSHALELEPDNVYTYCNRGSLYAQQNELDKAIADYNRALERKPDLVAAYIGRGDAYVKQKRIPQAIEDFNRAADLDPGQSRTYNSRGLVYKGMRDWQHALDDFRQFISWDPVESPGYHRMACTLAATNDLEAIYELNPAKPPYYLTDALISLAWVLATHPDAKYRNGAQALRYAEAVMAIQSDRTATLFDVLAASYAEVGRFPEAVATARRGLKLATGTDQQSLAESIRGRLLLYQADRPCHVSLPKR
jgi:arabinofuranosyltransferase